MVRYLSYHRDHINFVANYYFKENLVCRDTKYNFKSFTLILEEGLEDFVLGDSCDGYINYFRKAGKRQMFVWISCLIKGILQLQELGIFHADLEFRNTIQLKCGDGKGQFIYKIIDFDYAFKVREGKQERHLSLLSHTKKLLQFWLSSRGDLRIGLFQYIFRHHRIIFKSSDQDSTKIRKLEVEMEKSSKHSDDEKVEFLLNQLQRYMLVAHRYQVEKLIQELKGSWPDLDGVGRVLELVQQIPVIDENQNRDGYFRVIEYLGK